MKLKMFAQLSEEMDLVDRYMREYLAPAKENGKTAEIINHVLAASGKRLRPQLLLLSGRLGPNYAQNKERLCKLGALVELVHMASLIHDDIVDDSPLRRGSPTIQSKFGKDAAVYAGDLILGQVMHTLFRENMMEEGREISSTIQDMCRGEIGQMECRFNTQTTKGQYMRNIYGKTATMFALSCWLGGQASGCSMAIRNALHTYGENLGYLFQIQDDLMDFMSDSQTEGKPDHMDFQCGVFTLPVIYAMEAHDFRPGLQRLSATAKDRSLTEVELSILDRIVLESGGMDKTKRAMDYFGRQAGYALEVLPGGETAAAMEKILKMLQGQNMMIHLANLDQAAVS